MTENKIKPIECQKHRTKMYDMCHICINEQQKRAINEEYKEIIKLVEKGYSAAEIATYLKIVMGWHSSSLTEEAKDASQETG